MSGKTSHFRLGLFIIIGIALLAGLVVSLSKGDLFRPQVTLETYFDESVQGLDIGSKVRYRGVAVGTVSAIGFTYNRYQQEKPPAERKQYVLVEMSVYSDQLGEVGGSKAFVDRLVENGLRVRMAPVGITGIVYLELDFARGEPRLPVNWQPAHLYVPSRHSTVTSFVEALERIMDRLEGIDLAGMVKNLDALIAGLNRKVDAFDAGGLARELSSSLSELRTVVRHADRVIGAKEFQALPADAAASLRRLRELLDSPELARTLKSLDRGSQRLDRALEGREDDIGDLLANLRSASGDLKALTGHLRQSPAGVLLMQPPQPTDAYSP